jgi:transposase
MDLYYRRGDILKVLWFAGQGLMLLAKRLERGRFIWPQADEASTIAAPEDRHVPRCADARIDQGRLR